MFTHVMIGAKDTAQGKAFYDKVLGALGWPEGGEFRPGTVFYSHNGAAFGVGKPIEGDASHANGGTIGFAAQSKEQVDAFHAAALAHGGTDEGAPGLRPHYTPNFYAAYVRDPDGNKLACVFHRYGMEG